MNNLKSMLEKMDATSLRFWSDFVPIKLVTLLEVRFREQIRTLVNGDKNAKKLAGKLLSKISSKDLIDALIQIDERNFTSGDVVSIIVKCSRLSDIFSAMEELCNNTFKDALEKARENWIEAPGEIFLTDPGETYKMVGRVFEVRHIVVHEHPQEAPYKFEELPAMIDHVALFSDALQWAVSTLLHGQVPRSQSTMNRMAWSELAKTEIDLLGFASKEVLVSECLEDYGVHHIWNHFCQRTADERSGLSLGRAASGSIAPMIYGFEAARLNKWRVSDLIQSGTTRF
jgi:hypothetical protein